MKNRKLLIISFLVVATLVTGVGFAALTGSLGITGGARFIGSGAASAEIRDALNFTAVEAGPTNVVATLTNASAETGFSKTADMTVEFHDLDATQTGPDAKYLAYADFTISYGQSELEVLPDMSLCALTGTGDHAATVSLTPNGTVSGTFAIKVYWITPENQNDTEDEVWTESQGAVDTSSKTLSAGQSVIMRVVITYVEDTTDHPDDSFSANINVSLPFHTVDNTSGS